MNLSLRTVSLSVIILISLIALKTEAQSILPMDSVENKVVFRGSKVLIVSSKKKIMEGLNSFVNEKQNFPPMVFSVIKESKNELVIKGLTEVPSLKSLHPISFRLKITAKRKELIYRADGFYFEDIKLSLEDWLEKYQTSSNERHIKTVKMVSAELESYIFLSLDNLAKKINNN